MSQQWDLLQYAPSPRKIVTTVGVRIGKGKSVRCRVSHTLEFFVLERKRRCYRERCTIGPFPSLSNYVRTRGVRRSVLLLPGRPGRFCLAAIITAALCTHHLFSPPPPKLPPPPTTSTLYCVCYLSVVPTASGRQESALARGSSL